MEDPAFISAESTISPIVTHVRRRWRWRELRGETSERKREMLTLISMISALLNMH